jgi:transposase-like protein
MVHATTIKCPHCGSNTLVKQGKTGNGTQKWQCNSCKKYFRLEYLYRAWQVGMKEKIIKMTLNSNGACDTGRVLKISKDTFCSILKKLPERTFTF